MRFFYVFAAPARALAFAPHPPRAFLPPCRLPAVATYDPPILKTFPASYPTDTIRIRISNTNNNANANSFAEQDVLILSTLLHAVGLKLRADDPAAMKAFVVAAHEAAARARARGGTTAAGTTAAAGAAGAGGGDGGSGGGGSGGGGGGLTKRAELMLELVMDIKNNR